MKLGILASHPIQYQAPLFSKLSEEIDLTVYFRDRGTSENKKLDPEFGLEIKWDIPLLEGYKYVFLNNIFDFLERIFKKEFDVLMIYGWNSPWQWLGIILGRLRGMKILIQGETPFNQEILKTGFKQKIRRIFLRNLFRLVNNFLYIGEENRKFYKFMGVSGEKLFFTPYAVDNERFMSENARLKPHKKELRRGMGLEEDEVVILFSGKLIPKKRPMDLLEAFELLDQKNKALVFVGEGELRGQLERYVEEKGLKKVIFAGFKNQTEISKYYSIADIFVLPSGMGETWGLVVNEAMCFGLPVIVSDMVGCGADLVKNGENGFVFRRGNVGELKEFMYDLMTNTDKRLLSGARSFGIVRGYGYHKDLEGILSTLAR